MTDNRHEISMRGNAYIYTLTIKLYTYRKKEKKVQFYL